MKIKICGITNIEDALLAHKLGADLLGVILDNNVKRHGTRELIDEMKSYNLNVVGVYTSMPESIEDDFVQLHFPHGYKEILDVKSTGASVISVIDMNSEQYDKKYHEYINAGSDFILFEDRSGIIKRLPELLNYKKIGIAGKISPENVSIASSFNPELIDASSGLELYTGKKSPERLKMFFEALK
ncbi:phosphoribosylanthranilate isomerase [Picrophilus oshimae]|uniref:N-(5'-phosphoribosyl)anthranilate isomerase n=1 Tax=Picrophilus torridus (strain ATCC 700027 / DSM 9790 / JCM 10055 / NBRC 100828 / KAW 2/3) TaxID=1122961 RepID=A0A8G2FWH3_PICTO|nr:phosphoribosylanthranilate isomerase [Picrophilus oshimae]SMD30757.1 phosphoribosylanthranilate isomerase [Picrophilus oshimae DSM 9789]